MEWDETNPPPHNFIQESSLQILTQMFCPQARRKSDANTVRFHDKFLSYLASSCEDFREGLK